MPMRRISCQKVSLLSPTDPATTAKVPQTERLSCTPNLTKTMLKQTRWYKPTYNNDGLVNIQRADYLTNQNTRMGTFRFIDDVTKQVTPELIKYFNSSKNFECEKGSHNPIYQYYKNWKSPYGYAPWGWVIHWLSRLGSDNFGGDQKVLLDNLSEYKSGTAITDYGIRLQTNDEVSLIAQEFFENRGEPIWLTKEITEAFAHTDIPNFDPIENEVLPSFALMLPKHSFKIVEYEEDGNELKGQFTEVLTILVVTNTCWRKRLREYLNNTKEFGKKKGYDPKQIEQFITDTFDEDNYLGNTDNSYMFESGFKLLALDDKCGGLLVDFNWKTGTKNLRLLDSKNGKPIKRSENEDCFYLGLINVVANAMLHLSHDTEYVTVKSPGVSRGTGFGDSDELPPQPATWIGEDYHQPKTKYEYPVDHVSTKGKSPRPHWRRGHNRFVCQGPGRKQRVLKWIKPVYVNGALA